LVEPYVMNARVCISYLTIELRGGIPEELREPMGAHVFGCDICQDVCPWNHRAPITAAEHFQPRTFSQPGAVTAGVDSHAPSAQHSLYLPDLEWLASMTEEEFRTFFRDSAIKRTKWRGLVRNACIALGNSRVTPNSAAHARLISLLQRLAGSPEIHIAESAQWALARIQSPD